MIPLLLLCLCPLLSASSPSSDPIGKWTVFDANGKPCIKVYAQLDLTLSYITDDDELVDVQTPIPVPPDSTSTHSNCDEQVQIGDTFVDSQVLQLDFPHNEGWNVRLAFTRDQKFADSGDWTLYHVNITANYSSMADIFKNVPKDHIHTYYSLIDFNNPPEISEDEYTRVGDYLYCPSPQAFMINKDPHVGPPATLKLTNTQMQAYMTTDDFGTKVTCADDQTNLDLVPVIVSAVLAGLVLFTLIAYFIYRSRLPTDILDMTQPEFEDEEHHHHKENSSLNHHDNYGYHEDHDHRF